MSLLTSTVYRELEGALAPREDTGTCTLTRSDAGWTLLILLDRAAPSGWSTSLAPHGAGVDATPRVAQAVGGRVLRELDVEVGAWVPARSDEFVAETTSRARLVLAGLGGH